MKRLIRCFSILLVSFINPFHTAWALTYVVDNTSNTDNLAIYTAGDGNNSLRKCIRLANANAGADNIDFNIPGAGPFIITSTNTPTVLIITGPVTLNGFSQPSAAPGNPLIQLTGNSIDLLQLNAGSDGSTIRGLVMYGANCNGIRITNSHNHIISGNYIGTNLAGTATGHATMMQHGITMSGATGCLIGGTGGVNTRNLISGNSQRAVYISASSHNTTVQGNFIGVGVTGNTAIANQQGIEISASNNQTIGGTVYAARNILSGNTQNGIVAQTCTTLTVKGNFIGLGADGATTLANASNGIDLRNPTSTVTIGGLTEPERNVISFNNTRGINVTTCNTITIQNNYIGTDSTGMLSRRNNNTGIFLSGSTNILIGGTTYSARNIISGNTQSGISAQTCTTLVIKGNFIGVGKDGTTALPNTASGIDLQSPTSAVTIGGLTVPERNVISCNAARGIMAANSNTITVQNNYIGTDSTGMIAKGNTNNCIEINGNSANVLIGGTTYSARNILCSSVNESGIRLSNCSTSVIIKGNFIGIGKDGNINLGNKGRGISVNNTTPLTIGGPTAMERNIVSCNQGLGLELNTNGVVSIQNNYIGTDSTGMIAKGNSQTGLSINTTTSLIIGGSSVNLRNIIASNNNSGVIVSQSPGVIFRANYIGIAADGATSLGNAQKGVLIQTSAGALIGGALPAERNIISNNLQQALEINNSAGPVIYNNYIGVDASGNLNKGNGQNGIVISACANIQIGAGSAATRNICSGNGQDGILINGDCPNAIIKGNFCGIGADGVTVIPNTQSGIRFGGGNSNGAQIGGSAFMDRNVCSGNGFAATADSRDGIRIEGGSSNHIIKGNYCGVDSTGTIAIGNNWAGLSINEANDCIIGGTGTYEGNICSANTNEGVYFRNAARNVFTGNFIGTDKTGNIDLGNEDYGVNIRFVSIDNIIGGTTVAQGNIIAYTKGLIAGSGQGVYVEAPAQRNKIVRNKIYCNAAQGIILEPAANEGIAAPVILVSGTNDVSGTGSTDGDSIHVYLNIKSGGFCDCEGESYIGGAIVSGGTWSLTHNLGLTTAQTERVSSTETTINKSTSEFSDCITPLPVELLSFTARRNGEQSAVITWTTASEENSAVYEVQRSTDGIHFYTVQIVMAAGNSGALLNYSVNDDDVPSGIVYYRLKQVDQDGTSSYSKVVSLDFSSASLEIIQVTEGFSIRTGGSAVHYEVYSATGALMAEGELSASSGTNTYLVRLNLASALYIVHASDGINKVVQKIQQ